MASVKETEFFNTNYAKGASWYESKFPSSGFQAVGEISNNYYLDAVVAERIAAYNPEMKIIFNLRQPESLLKSMYGFGERRGLPLTGERTDLDIPVGKVMGSGYDSRAKHNALVGTDTPTVFEAAMLSSYIGPFVEIFGTRNVHFFILERMTKNPAAELAVLYRFLGVDEAHIPDTAEERVNDALVPQSKSVARAASSVAFALRRVGADRLLTALHDSTAIKNTLFKKRESVELALPLTEVDRATLAHEENRIIELVPEVREHWLS